MNLNLHHERWPSLTARRMFALANPMVDRSQDIIPYVERTYIEGLEASLGTGPFGMSSFLTVDDFPQDSPHWHASAALVKIADSPAHMIRYSTVELPASLQGMLKRYLFDLLGDVGVGNTTVWYGEKALHAERELHERELLLIRHGGN